MAKNYVSTFVNTEPRQLPNPKQQYVRHQSTKERERNLKRLAAQAKTHGR